MTEIMRMVDAITIRTARDADSGRLAAMGAQTFTETFGHMYPPGDLTAFLGEAHTPARYAAWIGDPAFRVWIAERGERDLGYAVAGPCHLPHAEVTPDCGELWRLYVRRETQGSGLGGRLLRLALDWLERPGRRLWVGVWSENLGAQRLYARHGFEKAGAYEFHVGESRDRDLILARPRP